MNWISFRKMKLPISFIFCYDISINAFMGQFFMMSAAIAFTATLAIMYPFTIVYENLICEKVWLDRDGKHLHLKRKMRK